MNKTLYIVRDNTKDGDSFDVCVTYDQAEAQRAARIEYNHLTERERKTSEIAIEGYTIEVDENDDRSAKDLYDDMLFDDDDQLHNPSSYVVYLPEWTDAELEDIAKTLEAEGCTIDDEIDLDRFQRPDRQPLTDEDRERIISRLGFHSDYRTKPRRTNDSRIANARLARGWTQAQLAEAIGCKPSQIANWETGFRTPKIQAIKSIAEVLGVDWKDLV